MDLSTFKVGSTPWLAGVLHGSVSLPCVSRDATIAMTVRDYARKQDPETQKLFETSVGGLFLQLLSANLAEHWRLIAGGCAIAGDDEGALEALNTAIKLTPDATNLVRLRDRSLCVWVGFKTPVVGISK